MEMYNNFRPNTKCTDKIPSNDFSNVSNDPFIFQLWFIVLLVLFFPFLFIIIN